MIYLDDYKDKHLIDDLIKELQNIKDSGKPYVTIKCDRGYYGDIDGYELKGAN